MTSRIWPGLGDHWGTTFVWGVSDWGSGGVSLIRRVDFSGLGEVVEITVENLEAAETFTYLGCELFYRDRRRIRRPGS